MRELAAAVTVVPAVVVVSLIAYLPGWLVAFLAVSLLVDRQPPLRQAHPAVPVSEPRPGKSNALNTGLAAVRTELVITLDADTVLHPRAVRQLVARLLSAPADVQAVAGSVLVRNSRDNLWTRMQEWDYFLGIASVKRMQGLYHGTLVAQGAFSLYRAKAVLAAGGWPDAIGEDIVLTWQLMRTAPGSTTSRRPSPTHWCGCPVWCWRRRAATGSSAPTPWPCCR